MRIYPIKDNPIVSAFQAAVSDILRFGTDKQTSCYFSIRISYINEEITSVIAIFYIWILEKPWVFIHFILVNVS